MHYPNTLYHFEGLNTFWQYQAYNYGIQLPRAIRACPSAWHFLCQFKLDGEQRLLVNLLLQLDDLKIRYPSDWIVDLMAGANNWTEVHLLLSMGITTMYLV